MKTRLGALLLGMVLVVGVGQAAAQERFGGLAGVVRDAGNLVLPGATVTVTSVATGATRTVVTGPAGEYMIPDLEPGRYVVTVELQGFSRVEVQDVAVMLGKSLKDQGYAGGLWPRQPLVAVKAPVFSMAKLRGVEVHLGPEMKSTGEVMGIDHTFDAAFYKALIAAGLALPPRGSVLITLADEDKSDALEMIRQLVTMGHPLYATEGTAALIRRAGMPVQEVLRRIGRGHPDMLDVILARTVDWVINTPGPANKEILDGLEIRRAAVERGIPCITSLDTARTVVSAMAGSSAVYSVQPLPSYRRRDLGY